MKFAIAAALVLGCGASQAQVYKCPRPGGGVEYSDAPCVAGRQMNESNLRANSLQAQRPAPPPAAPDLAPGAPQGAQPARHCLDRGAVRNLETAASSVTDLPIERRIKQLDAQRGRACKPLLTDLQKSEIRSADLADREAAKRARRAKATPPPDFPNDTFTQCIAGVCRGVGGAEYEMGPGGAITRRSDGARCQKSAGVVNC